MLTEIEKVQRHAKRIASGKDPKVKPGTPARFTEACTPGDAIWLGDLALVVGNGSVPKGYTRCEKPKLQLVPGETQGARHCLDSLEGVEMYLPANSFEE